MALGLGHSSACAGFIVAQFVLFDFSYFHKIYSGASDWVSGDDDDTIIVFNNVICFKVVQRAVN